MYFSGYSVDDNRRFVEEAGFEVRTATLETIHEDGRPVAFLWVVAQKRSLDRQESVRVSQRPLPFARFEGAGRSSREWPC